MSGFTHVLITANENKKIRYVSYARKTIYTMFSPNKILGIVVRQRFHRL